MLFRRRGIFLYMKSRLGIEVIDGHAHFVTYDVMRSWIERSGSLERFRRRIASHTDMSHVEMPSERWDTAEMWINELDRYGITAIGMMVSPAAWDEFNDARRRFPGRFLGYANIDPREKIRLVS